MPDTQRSVSAALALVADNTTGDISPQDLRDCLVTWRPGHGQLYVPSGAATAVSIAATGTFYEVTEPAWTLSSGAYLWDESGGNGRLTYTGSADVMAHIACTLSLTCDSPSQVIRAKLGVSGTPDDASEVQMKLGTANDVNSTASHLVASFSNGDYVSLWVSNETSTADVDFECGNIQLMTMPM